MNKFNRELLVLISEKSNPQRFENTVEQLHNLLYGVENSEKFSLAYEVINVNKRRVSRKSKTVASVMEEDILKPFVFLCNLN